MTPCEHYIPSEQRHKQAWCLTCLEWCYPRDLCRGCLWERNVRQRAPQPPEEASKDE